MKQEYNLDYFKSKNWFKIVRRENSAFLSSLLRLGSAIRNKDLNFDNRMKHHMMLFDDVYSVKEEFDQLKKRMIEKAEKDSHFVEKYLSWLESDCGRYLEKIQKIKEKYEAQGDQKLALLFKEYIDETNKIVSHLWPPLAIEDYIVGKVEKELARYIDPKNNFREYKSALQELLSSDDPSIIQKKHMAILRLAADWKLGKTKSYDSKIHQEFRKYCWVNDHGLKFHYETYDDFLKEIKDAVGKNPKLKLDNLKKESVSSRRKKIALAKKYKFGKKLLYWSELAGRMPHMRLLRVDAIFEGAYILRDNFFEAVFRKLGLENFSDCFHWEVYKALKTGSINKKRIKNREKAHNFVIIGRQAIEFTDKEARKLKEYIEDKGKEADEIKGNVACVGYGKGAASVIHSTAELSKFKKGNILVTSMTTPDYIPLMKKAAAIVTDEGGISCHAAIVSRELKIPCIIGTKIATKVLKDGDVVEVDANKGIVRILK